MNSIKNINFPYTKLTIQYLKEDVLKLKENTIKYIYTINSNNNKYINKLKNKDRYNNKEIYNKINYLIKNVLLLNLNLNLKQINKYIIYIDNFIIFYNKTNELEIIQLLNNNKFAKKIIKIYTDINIIIDSILDSYVFLTDLYFIKRFLDKDYITNSIIYTGNLHLYNITYILIKYFNYKYTHVFYKSKELNNIKLLKTTNYEYLYVMNNILTSLNEYGNITQCVNLFKFPINFN
jgi:hypothetical protein